MPSSKYDIYITKLYNELKIKKNQKKKKNIHVVLEGGGFSGAYEIGVMLFLQYLEKKEDIQIQKISGVSIGSIVGLLYLTNKLHYYDKYYSKIRDDWYNNHEMESLCKFIKKIVYSISDEEFEKIKKDKFYVSYYNLQSKQHITKSHFVNKNDLYTTLMKSTHMPFLKSKYITYNDNTNKSYIDGMYPYIFTHKDNSTHENKNERTKILYVSINQIQKLHNCIDTRNEKDCFSRILHGIIYCFDLFKYKKSNEYCSFVNEWSILDITFYRVKQFMLVILMYEIYLFDKLTKFILPYIKNIALLKSIYIIIMNYFDDLIDYFLN